MIWSLPRKNNSEKLKDQARADYELAADDNRASRSFRVKIALRCRANIDRAFINSAKATESADAEDSVKEMKASPYQLIKSGDGYIYTYIREEHAERIYELGQDFQEGSISAYEAVSKAQVVADQICQELKLPDSFQTLAFLQEDNDDREDDEPGD
ncbi:MAG: hypothetical protein PsegKO_34180 [Pseudohongiellaceae bacterium]